MNRRRAKRIACELAARCIEVSRDQGWEIWHELLVPQDNPDHVRVEGALSELLEELHQRGEAPPADRDLRAYNSSIGLTVEI